MAAPFGSHDQVYVAVVPSLVNVHSHLRDRAMMEALINYLVDAGCDAVLAMPNAEGGLTESSHVLEYNAHASSLVPAGKTVTFIKTVMITEHTTPDDIDRYVHDGIMDGKIYPLMRTTNSEKGVRYYHRLLPAVQRAGELGMRIHVHPEFPWLLTPNRDAEYMFIPLVDMFIAETNATIIWEHGTDARCVPFWKEWARSKKFYVTLTAHHLAACDDDVFGDVSATNKPPHKTLLDQRGLIGLIAENHEWVMAGPDDAPHDESAKHVDGQCACGAYTAPFLYQLYAHALDAILQVPNGLDIFVRFTSGNARTLYKLPRHTRGFRLSRKPFVIPRRYPAGPWSIIPFWAGRELLYSIEEISTFF
jgi:dihydroorotase